MLSTVGTTINAMFNFMGRVRDAALKLGAIIISFKDIEANCDSTDCSAHLLNNTL